MKYSEKELYEYMDSQRPVCVITKDGQEYVGQCWAYSSDVSSDEYGLDEACLDMGGIIVPASDIKEIRYID